MGRPLAVIDVEQVYKLARLGCTNQEIGDWFNVNGETIRVRFMDVLKLARSDQKISLRRKQHKTAMKGSVPMLIHLGKHYLGQTDSPKPDETENPELDDLGDVRETGERERKAQE